MTLPNRAHLAFITMGFLLSPFQHALEAKVSDHFKKPIKDEACHRINGVDFIYMINLDERPEKFAQSSQALAPYNIYPFRFSAVNGWKLSLETINDVGIKHTHAVSPPLWGTCYLTPDLAPYHEILQTPERVYFSHCLSRGAVGIVLSHLSVLQDAYDSGFQTIWVMEDDIEVIRNPLILSSLIQKLDLRVGEENWDILFTDRDTKNRAGEYVPCCGYARRPNFIPDNPTRFSLKRKISKDFYAVGARYGAYSMIVRRSGMKKILSFIKKHKIFLPYDMEFYLPNDIKMYSVSEDVVSTQIQALSDNGGPRYNENRSE